MRLRDELRDEADMKQSDFFEGGRRLQIAEQWSHGKEMHICPLQFDIVDRIVEQFSMKDEEVFDPFSGLGTVPMRAIKKGRRGRGAELNIAYWRDSITYCRAAEMELATPSLFDFDSEEEAA